MLNRRKALVPAVGLATAAVTTVAGFAPALAAPDTGSDDVSAAPSADPTKDGTYESCSAYFGFGKEEGAVDLVEFDVAVSGPAGSPAPTVENGGVSVILEIENTEGDVFECVPEEVTEEQWDEEYGGAPSELDLPAYPGPGHYIFPTEFIALTSSAAPELIAPMAVNDTIGAVESVGFRVVHVTPGYELVAPLSVEPLQSQFTPLRDILEGEPPSTVVSYVAEVAGGEAAEAYVEAFAGCVADPQVDPTQSEALTAAVEALYAAFGIDDPVGDVECSEVVLVGFYLGYIFAVDATTDYTKVIDLAAEVTPTTPTTPAARPAVVTPRFTG